MRGFNSKLPIAFIFMVGAFTLISCSKNSNNATNPSNSGGGNLNDSTVTISGFAFSPATLNVKTGTTVIWVNQDATVHTVTSDNGGFASSENLGQGATYAFKFTTAGAYPYHCSIHTFMKGTITVGP